MTTITRIQGPGNQVGSSPNGSPPHKAPQATTSDTATGKTAPSYEETREVAEKLQKRLDEAAPDPHLVAIRNDERTNQFVIQIKDPDGKVVKQFPPEKVLNLHRKMDDLSGMVIDEMI